jgi:hypothetical protein
MVCLDACTTTTKICEFFLAAPIFASQDTFKKIPMEWMFLREMVVLLQETYLASGRWLACCFCFVSAS